MVDVFRIPLITLTVIPDLWKLKLEIGKFYFVSLFSFKGKKRFSDVTPMSDYSG